MSRSPSSSKRRYAAIGVPLAAGIGEWPARLDLTGVPVDTDILVDAVLLVREVDHAAGSGDNRDHHVGVVDLVIDPVLLERPGLHVPGKLLHAKRRRPRHAEGECIRPDIQGNRI